jgi:hypothetical protein
MKANLNSQAAFYNDTGCHESPGFNSNGILKLVMEKRFVIVNSRFCGNRLV